MVNRRNRNILVLLVLYVILMAAGIFMIDSGYLGLALATFSTLLTIMVLITLGAYLLIRIGIKRGEKDQGIFMLAGLGGKFLAYLIMILIYWAVGKNLTKEFIIVFFVLYLLLTFFLVRVLFKTLKTKRL
jgi:hypothetical protein